LLHQLPAVILGHRLPALRNSAKLGLLFIGQNGSSESEGCSEKHESPWRARCTWSSFILTHDFMYGWKRPHARWPGLREFCGWGEQRTGLRFADAKKETLSRNSRLTAKERVQYPLPNPPRMPRKSFR